MQSFQATLSDDVDQAITNVEGSIQSPEEAQGPRQGEFDLPENESFMQGVLEQKTFCLDLDDGNRLTIRVDSVSAGARPGYSRVAFSVS
jgi:hypothetical protein